MKIIQLTPFFYPVVGGVEIQVMDMSKKLIELGHEVRVITSNSSRNNSKIARREEIIEGVPIKRFNSLFSISKFYPVVPGILWELLKADFDVVHVHGFRKLEVYMALLVAKIRRKKIVVTTHNPFTANIRSKLLSIFIQLHDITLGKLFSRFLDAVIAIVPSEVEVLQTKFSIPPHKIHVIPNGINEIFYSQSKLSKDDVFAKLLSEDLTQQQRYNLKDWDRIVLSVCRFNKVKGLQNLKLAVDQNPNALFLFVGGDDGSLTSLQKLYSKSSNVFIVDDYVDRRTVHELMTISDLFVLPSLHEPFGLTPVEAAASGLPVLATTIGGPIETLGIDYDNFLDPTDQTVWAQTISSLLNDENRLNELTEKGIKIAQKYKWDNVIQMIIEVYK
jgi:glycosyltransferase involved in cell wall biosynthesis